jgi:iron complex outermembrane receptor protein
MTASIRRIAALAFCVGAAGAPVRAQSSQSDGLTSLSLEELLKVDVERVFSASRFVQDASRAPASISIITAEDIRRFGYQTLAEAIRSVPGFYTTYDRNYTYLGVRGFGRPGDYNGRVLLLIDGHRSNDVVYDQALIGSEFTIDLALVERIEVIRGPSSSLYGSSAFFGVVNVITRRGRDLRGAEIELEAGTLSTGKVRVSGGSRTENGLEYSLSGSAYRSDGQNRLYYPEFDAPETNSGIVLDQDADSLQSLFGQVSKGGFSLEASWATRDKHVPTAAFDTLFGDPRFVTTDRRFFATLQYGRRIGADTEAVGRIFVDDMHYDGDYPYENSTGDGTTVQADVADGTGVGGEFLVSRRILGRDTGTVGFEVRNNFRLDQWTRFDGEAAYDTESFESARKWAAFGQYEASLSRDLLLSAGLRYDYESDVAGSVNPRLGLIITPSRPSTFKILYGTAFRAPNAYEQFYWPGQVRLDPERIQTAEGVWELRLGANVRASASVFYNVIDDLISEDEADNAGGGIQFINRERVSAQGVEWSLEGRRPGGWLAWIGHTFEDASDRQTGEALSNAPRNLLKLRLLAPLGSEQITAGLEGEYVGERRAIDGQLVDGYYRQNVTIAARLRARLQASFTIGNLFNKEYGDVGAVEHRQAVITQDGRTARASVTYRF